MARPSPALAALAAAALALAGLAGCGRKPEEPPLKAPPGRSVAERVQVLNADVLVVDGRHVRLADAAAPQPVPQARCWAEALAAKQATLAARDIVRSAQDVRLEPTGGRDEYGREIAHVLLDNQDLGRTLRDAGFVAENPDRRFGWCDPISAGGAGAPDVKSLMDFSRG